jgi:hypothetical protein
VRQVQLEQPGLKEFKATLVQLVHKEFKELQETPAQLVQ